MKKQSKNFMEVLLFALLIVQFLGIAYSNLFLIDQNLDCDNAKLMRHIIEMWEHKTLLVPQWAYTTTLEWDCTTVFAVLLYGILGNVYLACGISNCILALILLVSVFFLFKGKEQLYPLICANLILIPYQVGMLDYYNMLFFAGTQYIVKITIPIMMIGLVLELQNTFEEKKKPSKLFWGIAFLYVFYLALTCMSSGIYVMACGIIPVIGAYICHQFFKWKKIPGRIWLFFAISALLFVVGQYINQRGMGGARGQGMTLTNVYQFFANLSATFVGVFELFGGVSGREELSILSLEGIGIVGKCILVLALLICGIRAVYKCINKQGDLRTLMLISIFVWNYFILCVTDTRAGSATSEYRYHLIGMIPLICVLGMTVIDGLKTLRKEQQKILFITGFTALLFLNVICNKALYDRGEQHADLKEFVAYCDTLDLDYVYMYNESDDGDICRLLGENAIYMCICDDASVWAYGYYDYFKGAYLPSTNAIVAVNEELEQFGDEFYIDGYRLVKFEKIGPRNLYYFAQD